MPQREQSEQGERFLSIKQINILTPNNSYAGAPSFECMPRKEEEKGFQEGWVKKLLLELVIERR